MSHVHFSFYSVAIHVLLQGRPSLLLQDNNHNHTTIQVKSVSVVVATSYSYNACVAPAAETYLIIACMYIAT